MDLIVELVLNFLHHGAEVASAHVGLHDDAALDVFAVDDVRAFAVEHVGEQRERHLLAALGIDEHFADGLDVVARFFVVADGHIVGLLPVEHLGDGAAVERGFEQLIQLADLHAVELRLLAVHLHFDLRHEHLLFDL